MVTVLPPRPLFSRLTSRRSPLPNFSVEATFTRGNASEEGLVGSESRPSESKDPKELEPNCDTDSVGNLYFFLLTSAKSLFPGFPLRSKVMPSHNFYSAKNDVVSDVSHLADLKRYHLDYVKLTPSLVSHFLQEKQ